MTPGATWTIIPPESATVRNEERSTDEPRTPAAPAGHRPPGRPSARHLLRAPRRAVGAATAPRPHRPLLGPPAIRRGRHPHRPLVLAEGQPPRLLLGREPGP